MTNELHVNRERIHDPTSSFVPFDLRSVFHITQSIQVNPFGFDEIYKFCLLQIN